MKKAILLTGSPKEDVNTRILSQEVRRGLADGEVKCEVFFLNDMKIENCQECYYCKRNNVARCIIQDDMQCLYNAINEADGLIIASPIDFSGVAVQTKICINRMFPYIGRTVESLLTKGKTVSFVFIQEQPPPALCSAEADSFMDLFEFFGFEVRDSMIVVGFDIVHNPMGKEQEDLKTKAYNIGRRLIS